MVSVTSLNAVSMVCGNAGCGPNFNPFDISRTLTPTISVIDSGIGIPLEHQQRVFERFIELIKQNQSSLVELDWGASNSRAHMYENNNATVILISEEGKGSNFTIKWNKK